MDTNYVHDGKNLYRVDAVLKKSVVLEDARTGEMFSFPLKAYFAMTLVKRKGKGTKWAKA